MDLQEQIKNHIDSELKKGLSNLGQALNNFAIPLISQYRMFTFYGAADGTDLAPNFVPADIVNKYFVLKSIQIECYYPSDAVTNEDFFVSDGGGSVFSESILGAYRIDRLFPQYGNSGLLSLMINGSASPLFTINPGIVPPFPVGNIPLDSKIDNIFYRYPDKLTSLNIRLNAIIFRQLQAAITVNPNVKVYLECYLF